MSNLSVTEARAKLSSHFSTSTFQGNSDNYGKGWDALWQSGDFLPWDRFAPSPALVDTLINHRSVIGNHEIEGGRRKKALVPGCGRGVDVLLLESYGYEAVGLEYSAKAVEECEKFAAERGGEYEVKVPGGSRRFVQGDFYKDEWREKLGMKGETFDLIYDYTFFCAMQPSMRPAWAETMGKLLGPSPHSNLICLEFPTQKEAGAGGPPFASPSTAYMEHLSHPGKELEYNTDGTIKSNPLQPASEGGLERVGHWTPKDTHAIGKGADGAVKDRIAIWRHR